MYDNIIVEIKGLGLTINYTTEVIVKALKEAGIQVEVKDLHPAANPEELLLNTKKRLDEGRAVEKVTVKTMHIPWPG